MRMPRNGSRALLLQSLVFLAGTILAQGVAPMLAETPGAAGATPAVAAASGPAAPVAPCNVAQLGSPYIPLDSWMYTSLTRLYSLGYLDYAFLGLRPWTRASVIHMLEDTNARMEDAPANATTDEAQELYDKLWHELNVDAEGPCFRNRGQVRIESVYDVTRGISGTPLHDSWHLGQTITNDYG